MKKRVIRVSDELLEIIEHPKKFDPSKHTHCLWCGMIKVFPKKPCEICGLHGNSREVPGGSITVRYTNTPVAARNGTANPGRRRVITRTVQ